jgi:CCR4-NOT transcriptional complex subunit CAF120
VDRWPPYCKQQGIAPQQQQGYPQQPGQPQQGHPPQQQGYPPQQGRDSQPRVAIHLVQPSRSLSDPSYPHDQARTQTGPASAAEPVGTRRAGVKPPPNGPRAPPPCACTHLSKDKVSYPPQQGQNRHSSTTETTAQQQGQGPPQQRQPLNRAQGPGTDRTAAPRPESRRNG